jgi:hypothetical protein
MKTDPANAAASALQQREDSRLRRVFTAYTHATGNRSSANNSWDFEPQGDIREPQSAEDELWWLVIQHYT